MPAHAFTVVVTDPQSTREVADPKDLKPLADEIFASVAAFIRGLAGSDPVGVMVERVQEGSWCLKFRDHKACQLPDDVEQQLDRLYAMARQLGFEITVSYTVLCKHQLFVGLQNGEYADTIVACEALSRS